jgi:hypothetical protein
LKLSYSPFPKEGDVGVGENKGTKANRDDDGNITDGSGPNYISEGDKSSDTVESNDGSTEDESNAAGGVLQEEGGTDNVTADHQGGTDDDTGYISQPRVLVLDLAVTCEKVRRIKPTKSATTKKKKTIKEICIKLLSPVWSFLKEDTVLHMIKGNELNNMLSVTIPSREDGDRYTLTEIRQHLLSAVAACDEMKREFFEEDGEILIGVHSAMYFKHGRANALNKINSTDHFYECPQTKIDKGQEIKLEFGCKKVDDVAASMYGGLRQGSDGEDDMIILYSQLTFDSPLKVSPKTNKDLVNESRRKQSQTTKGLSSQSWLFQLITTNGPCSKAKYFYHSLAQEHFGAAKHYVEQHNIFDQYSLDPMDDSEWPEDLDAICIWDGFRSVWTRQPCSNAFHPTTGDGFRNSKFLLKGA